MTAPFPQLNPTLSRLSRDIVTSYGWIARLSDEINGETDLNLKKMAQLAFQHCRTFGEIFPASPTTAHATAIQAAFALEGISWATTQAAAADLGAIRTASIAFHQWVVGNLTEALNLSTNEIDENGIVTEVPAVISPKPAGAQTQIATLRALFT